MALFDFLKKKKEIEKAKEKQPEKKADKVLAAKPDKSRRHFDGPAIMPAKQALGGKTKKSGAFSFSVVKEPHISEKSTILGEKNKYVFKVYSHSNKQEIKKSVEGIYGVDVLGVNVIKIPHKKRRLGRTEGFKKGYSKAVVTIKEGQKIELF